MKTAPPAFRARTAPPPPPVPKASRVWAGSMECFYSLSVTRTRLGSFDVPDVATVAALSLAINATGGDSCLDDGSFC